MGQTKTYKVAIIHHSADLDGIFSGALAYLFWDKVRTVMGKNKQINVEFDLIGYNYGKDLTIDTWLNPYNENELKYDYIQFIDITPPMFWLEDVKKYINSGELYVEIFDHHKAAHDEIKNKFRDVLENKNVNFNYYFDSEFCAAYIYYDNLFGLTWFQSLYKSKLSQKGIFSGLASKNLLKTIVNYAHGLINPTNTRMIYLVDSYDTWKWKNTNPDGLAINEYFLLFKPETDGLENAISFLSMGYESKLDSILTKGYELIRIKEIFAKNQKHLFIEIDANNKLEKFIIINDKANTYSIDIVEHKINQAFEQPCSGPENDAELERYVNTKAIIFYNNIDFIKGTINLSFRHVDKTFNVSDFAKEVCLGNAGGHFGAAGGSMRLDMFTHLIQTNNKTEKTKQKQN